MEVKPRVFIKTSQKIIAFHMPTISFSRTAERAASNEMDGGVKPPREATDDSVDFRPPPASFLRLAGDGGAQQHGR